MQNGNSNSTTERMIRRASLKKNDDKQQLFNRSTTKTEIQQKINQQTNNMIQHTSKQAVPKIQAIIYDEHVTVQSVNSNK